MGVSPSVISGNKIQTKFQIFKKITQKIGIRLVGKRSWKERKVGKSEVEKSQAKLERTERSWKEPIELGKVLLK